MQGLVAEWLRPLQVQIARNDYSKWSLETIRHLRLSEVGSKPARVTFFTPSNQEPRHELVNEFSFRCTRYKINSTSTNSIVLHLLMPQHLWLLSRKVDHRNRCSFKMQGPVAEWLWPLQVRIARNDYSKWSLETIRHLLLSEAGSKPARVAFSFPLQPRNSTWIDQCFFSLY